ncbi:MAG: hypothetical protein MSG64_01650 [Pyrinomonadaceae bacterium MAG19_C2-C3]|nr:hypothetical protein [Pyrinomonadaceae bacterium MAG19_C2-C3]
MKSIIVFLLCLTFSSSAISQTKPVLQAKGVLDFSGQQPDTIITHKFLAGENKLLLVGSKTVRLLDVANAKFLESRLIEIVDFSEDRERVISPDGRRMLVSGNYNSNDKKDRVKRSASIWDLQTGKQIAILDRDKPVRGGFWSKNGKTLVTSSDRFAPTVIDDASAEIAFWDGETFKYRNSLPVDKVNWWHLSDDGEKCFFTVGTVKNLIIVKEISFAGGSINIWDVNSGTMEQAVAANDNNVERKTRAISVSPDEKHLAFVAQRPKSSDAERSLVVWEIDKSNYIYKLKPKYEIKPSPKISEFGVGFSPDGKYFALDAGKILQIYETENGEKRFELNVGWNWRPSYWLSDNKVLLYNNGSKMNAFDAPTGKQLYQQKLIYFVYEYKENEGTGYESTVQSVIDVTVIAIHPSRNLFVTYSKQYLKVFDSRTGEILQTLVSPPMDYSKKKPKLSDIPLISKAGWSDDGRTLYAISADGKSVSLWELLGN